MSTAVLTRVIPAARRAPITLWHLLSLDAPCVAAMWTAFLAHQFRLGIPSIAPVALGLAVWLLYVGDRIRDAASGEIAEERHRFHFLHCRGFTVVAVLVATMLVLLVVRLPHALRHGWFLLGVPLCVYLAAVHLLRLRRVSKEPLVAMFFAAGVTMPLLASRAVVSNTILLIFVAFGCLCWLNCIAIARWEQALSAADVCTAWLGRHFGFAVALTGCLATPLLRLGCAEPVGFAVWASATCLLLLDQHGRHLARTTRRALADAALLTPAVVWPVLALLKLR